ncbi:MAG: hypothetical protein WBL70_08180 [Candidatus Acidiferrales bacterium]
MNRKILMIVVAVCGAALLSACGSSAPIAVTLTTAPPSTLEINLTATIAATVANDSSNSGVTWSCTPSPCGTFNPAMTASGVTTVYTAPSTPGAVTITATSVKNINESVTGNVTIDAVATAASVVGQYAFYLSGLDVDNDFYAAAGSVTLDGAGNVMAGEEDLNDDVYGAAVVGDSLTGTYTVGNDGQGTMILNATTGGVADPLVGVAGTQTLGFTVVNNNHLLITEFDGAFTSGGSMDLQTAAAFTAGLSGNYAFALQGYLGTTPWVVGGVLTSTGTSSTGTADQNIGGTVTSGGTGGVVTTPDANGRGTFVLGGITSAYYVVGAEAVYFTDIDSGVVDSGQAYGQGSAPAFSAASLTGVYVMSQPYGISDDGELALAGQFTPDGVSAIAGVVDYNDDGFIPLEPLPDTLAASYAVAASGYGSITSAVVTNDTDFTTYGLYLTDPTLNIVDPNNTSGAGGALIVELDAFTLGQGFIVPQTSTSTVAGNFAVDSNGFNFTTTTADVIDATGQVLSDGAATFAGTAAVNDLSLITDTLTETSGETLAGAFTADTTNAGRYTLALTVNGAATANSEVFYQASPALSVHVDVDSATAYTNISSGVLAQQQ